MSSQNDYLHEKFGIDEIYFHPSFPYELLEKLHQRAAFSLDAENSIVQKYTRNDMILIFYKTIPSQSLICRFIEALERNVDKENFIRSNTLINQEELFSAIKSKKFVLVTHKVLVKEV